MKSRLVHVGYESIVRADSILVILPPQSATAKRLIKMSKDDRLYIDLCLGHKLRSVLLTDQGLIIGCCLAPRVIERRINKAFDIEPPAKIGKAKAIEEVSEDDNDEIEGEDPVSDDEEGIEGDAEEV